MKVFFAYNLLLRNLSLFDLSPRQASTSSCIMSSKDILAFIVVRRIITFRFVRNPKALFFGLPKRVFKCCESIDSFCWIDFKHL